MTDITHTDLCYCKTTESGIRPCSIRECERSDHTVFCHISPKRAVEQRESFDCMTACLATIFNCSYEEAPFLVNKYSGDPVDQWLAVMTKWLRERGFVSQSFSLTEPMMKHYDPKCSPWYWSTLWMGTVKSPRYDGEHAVVMRGADIIFDPHPKRTMGHLGFKGAEIFLPIDPAKLELR